jgi:hypothetical protein
MAADKTFDVSSNPTYISPTDNLMTPCTQKLSAQKQKRFTKCVPLSPNPQTSFYLSPSSRRGAKPTGQLFGQKDPTPMEHDQVEPPIIDLSDETTDEKMDEDMNPF